MSSIADIHIYVSDARDTHTSPRARPVADAPVEALLARVHELARAWIVALIEASPLSELGELPLRSLAADAPLLCTHVIGALGSDAELRLISERPSDLLAGARGAPATVRDVEALRGVLWAAVLAESGDASARLIADLADRLSLACASALASSLEQTPATATVGDVPPPPRRSGPRERVIHVAQGSPARGGGAVLIDERDEQPARAQRGPAQPQRRPEDAIEPVLRAQRPQPPDERATTARAPAKGRALPWDTPLQPDRSRRPPAAGAPDVDALSPPGGSETGEPTLRIRRRPGTPVDGF